MGKRVGAEQSSNLVPTLFVTAQHQFFWKISETKRQKQKRAIPL